MFRNSSWDRDEVSGWESRSSLEAKVGILFHTGLGLGFRIGLSFKKGVEVEFQDGTRIGFRDRD